MRRMATGAALFGFALVLAPSEAVLAQASAPKGRGDARAEPSLEEVAIMLAASDAEEVRSALEAAAVLPAGEVVPLIDDRVRAGLPHALLDVALDTLLLLGDASATPLLLDLARHRRPEVRVRALEVLAQVSSPSAEQAALQALGDLEPNVRRAAAEVLAAVGTRAAFPALVRAFELGVEGAPRALGKTAGAADVDRLVMYFGKYPLATLTPMLEALFARRDIAEAEQLGVVNALAALATDDARAALNALLTTLPRGASPSLRRALSRAAQGAGE